MRVISAIDDRQVILAILEHLGLWLVRSRPPPKIHDPPGGHDGVVSPYALHLAGTCCGNPQGAQRAPGTNTLILSTATPNTHGMNIFSHNA